MQPRLHTQYAQGTLRSDSDSSIVPASSEDGILKILSGSLAFRAASKTEGTCEDIQNSKKYDLSPPKALTKRDEKLERIIKEYYLRFCPDKCKDRELVIGWRSDPYDPSKKRIKAVLALQHKGNSQREGAEERESLYWKTEAKALKKLNEYTRKEVATLAGFGVCTRLWWWAKTSRLGLAFWPPFGGETPDQTRQEEASNVVQVARATAIDIPAVLAAKNDGELLPSPSKQPDLYHTDRHRRPLSQQAVLCHVMDGSQTRDTERVNVEFTSAEHDRFEDYWVPEDLNR